MFKESTVVNLVNKISEMKDKSQSMLVLLFISFVLFTVSIVQYLEFITLGKINIGRGMVFSLSDDKALKQIYLQLLGAVVCFVVAIIVKIRK
jgi:hypothetical protein